MTKTLTGTRLIRLCRVASWSGFSLLILIVSWSLVYGLLFVLDQGLPKNYPPSYAENPQDFTVITSKDVALSATLRRLEARTGDLIYDPEKKLMKIDPVVVQKIIPLERWMYRKLRPLRERHVFWLIPIFYLFNYIMIGRVGFIPWKFDGVPRKEAP